MVTEIRIYCEGGGQGRAKELFRKGMNSFLSKLREQASDRKIRWELIACGSKHKTYQDFCLALRTFPTAFNVLLVDSDGPKAVEQNPWLYLNKKSFGQDDGHCHLMVQVMESWFIANRENLAGYYNQGFQLSAIPKSLNVEEVGKDEVLNALNTATKKTSKGKYDKTRHAPEILQELDPNKVLKNAPHCKLLFQTLSNIITGTEAKSPPKKRRKK